MKTSAIHFSWLPSLLVVAIILCSAVSDAQTSLYLRNGAAGIGSTSTSSTYNGRVGINTLYPGKELHVYNTGEIRLKNSVASTSNAGIYWHSSSSYAIRKSYGSWSSPNYQQLVLDFPTGIILDPGTGNNSGYNKSYVEIKGGKGLRVSQGTVGIGTLAPPSGYLLAVNGKVIAEEVKVELEVNWPDYVFAADYDLMSLKNLSAYIEKNKHLPGVPSAAEVAEEGINLGAMNAQLLEKVEELSLHLIQLNERLEALEEENKALKNKK